MKTNTTEKATARPWRASENPDLRHHAIPIMAPFHCDGREPYHPLIIQCLRGSGNAPSEVANANAALIVKAVNEHDLLNAIAEAAKNVSDMLEYLDFKAAYPYAEKAENTRVSIKAVVADLKSFREGGR